jgi:Flp pilus assembly protein TadD
MLVLVPAGVVVALPLLPRDRAHDEWSAAVTLGEAWMRHSEPRLALGQFDRAVQVDDAGMMRNADTRVGRANRAEVFSSRGEALLALGDVPGARTSYERANELSPNNPQVIEALGEVCAMEGDLPAADSLFKRLGIAPSSVARKFLERAAAQDHAGNRNGVELCLRAALALDPHAEAAWAGLVRLLVVGGQQDSALAVLNRASAHGMDAALYAAHRVLIAASTQRTKEASAWRARIPDDMARHDPRVRATLELAHWVDR